MKMLSTEYLSDTTKVRQWEDLVCYNDLVNFINNDDGVDGLWRFKEIQAHQGLIKYHTSAHGRLQLWLRTYTSRWAPKGRATTDTTSVILSISQGQRGESI